MLSLTKGGVIIRDLSTGKGKFPSDFCTYKIVSSGQIIFCLFDIDETPRTVGLSRHNGMITGAYDVFSIENANPRFIEHYFLAIDDIKGLKPYYTGLRKTVSMDKFLNITVPLPPRDEQDQIVRYLDWKVSQINKLINAKRRQIALLAEQRHKTIKNAVRYADGCRKCKLKNLATFKSGTNLTSLQIETVGDYPVYGGNGLRGFYPEYSHSGEYLLVGRQGALCGNVHYVNGQFWPTEHAIAVKPHDLAHIKWLYYLLIDMNLNQYSLAAAQPGLSVEHVVNLPAYFPTFEKQKVIANYLDQQCANIDKIISKLNDEITLITEYCTRLISDAVTGKLDVHGVTMPKYEVVEDISANIEDLANNEDDLEELV